ncbi:uncharacterized protein LOC144867970 [Branchiostoma floridae x Branchiostoma japonicum]
MTSSSSLRFGGGLRLGREEEDGDFDRNKANSTAVDLEGGNDESLFESPGSPEQFSARTTPPRRRGGKTAKGSKPYHRVTTPKTVPRTGSQMLSRKLDDVLANQQEILKGMAKLQHMLEDVQQTKAKQRGAAQQKLEVSNDVRNLVRQGYDYAVNTQGKAKWNGAKGMTATSEANNATTQAVLEFVQGLLPGYGDKIGMVKAAVTTYFGSKRKEERRETKGKSEKHKKQCSRNTRIAKKLQHRLSALRAKTSYDPSIKQKVQRVLLTEYMSSEDSGDSDEEEKTFKTRPIPWQSDLFTRYKRELDFKYSKMQTDLARRQSVKRVPGPPSTSKVKKPILSEQDDWICKQL